MYFQLSLWLSPYLLIDNTTDVLAVIVNEAKVAYAVSHTLRTIENFPLQN